MLFCANRAFNICFSLLGLRQFTKGPSEPARHDLTYRHLVPIR